MDFTIRCNSLKCRIRLSDRAVVTTCSHIFCINCSEQLGLFRPTAGTRVCPACDTKFSNPDDAVATHLNPSEDYKTSILSGLSPNIIMECAGRGLAFYSYQTTQEILYQEFLAKSLTDKYANLSNEVDKIIHDANSEIVSLQDKVSALQLEHKNLEERNEELIQAFREKSRSQQQSQKLYQNLKTQVLASQVQLAASDDAQETLNYATGSKGFERVEPKNATYGYPVEHFQPDWLQNNHRAQKAMKRSNGSVGLSNIWESHNGSRNGARVLSRLTPNETPSQYRTRLPVPHSGIRGRTRHESHLQTTPRLAANRLPLRDLQPNVQGLRLQAYGTDLRK